MYLHSTAAEFGNATFRIDVRDILQWTMTPSATVGSVSQFPIVSSNAYVRAVPNGTSAFQASNTHIGTQNDGNSQYYRVANTNEAYRWFAGGLHSDTLGTPGVGGVTFASLDPSASMGKFTTGRLQLVDVQDADPAQSSPTFMIGDAASNLIMDNNEIMQRESGVMGELLVQQDGGVLRLGGPDSKVYINGRALYVSIGVAPVSPTVNDLWLDGTINQGIRRWNGSSWTKVNP
jgi:hypothetical protein